VWSAALQWSPTESTQIAFRRFRELNAHLDAESDHFVSTGEAVTATWFPIGKLGLSLEVSSEEQSYIGAESTHSSSRGTIRRSPAAFA
jgi:hypothetical protein